MANTVRPSAPPSHASEVEHRRQLANIINLINQTTPDYSRTHAEIELGVVPIDPRFPPGDVRRYGDDESAIQTAIDVAGISGGDDVTLPAGDWTISTLLIDKPGVRIVGQGSSSILRTTTDAPVFKIEASNVSVRGVTFAGNGAGLTQEGVYAEGTSSVPLRNIVIERIIADGLGGSVVRLADCEDSQVSGLLATNTGAASVCRAATSRRLSVSDVVAYNCAGKVVAFRQSEDCVAVNVIASDCLDSVGYTNNCVRVWFCNLIGTGADVACFKFSRNSRECGLVNAYLVSTFSPLYFQGSSDCTAVNVRGIGLGTAIALRINSHPVTGTNAHRNRVANSTFIAEEGAACQVYDDEDLGPQEDNRIENCDFYSSAGRGIDLRQCTRTRIVGGTVRNDSPDSGHECVSTRESTTDLIVRDLQVHANGAGAGVVVRCANAIFRDLDVRSESGNAFRVLAGADGTKIMGCTVAAPEGDGLSRQSDSIAIVAAWNVFEDGIGTSATNVAGYETNIDLSSP